MPVTTSTLSLDAFGAAIAAMLENLALNENNPVAAAAETAATAAAAGSFSCIFLKSMPGFF